MSAKCQKWTSGRLFDHLVGDGEQPRRHLDAERPRRAEPGWINATIGNAGCCARTASGSAAALLPTNAMNSRRLIASPAPRDMSGAKRISQTQIESCTVRYFQRTSAHVRFGSKADVASGPRHVRFACGSGHRARVERSCLVASCKLMRTSRSQAAPFRCS
jgi:hypothetical protein